MPEQTTQPHTELVAGLNDLLQLDHDIGTNTLAMDKVVGEEARPRLIGFRGDHQRRIRDLTLAIHAHRGHPYRVHAPGRLANVCSRTGAPARLLGLNATGIARRVSGMILCPQPGHSSEQAGTGHTLQDSEGPSLVLEREPVAPGERAQPFQVFDGERPVPVREYLEAHPRPDLFRLDERLPQLGSEPFGRRAGDVLLLTLSGLDPPLDDRFYFGPDGYRSLHGGATAQDSLARLVVARPQRTGGGLRETPRAEAGGPPYNLLLTRLSRELLRGGEPAAVGSES